MTKRILTLVLSIFLFFGCKEEQVMHEETESIGVATIGQNGILRLRLRAESDDGIIGDALLEYRPDDPQYAAILEHLGGLQPGQEKSVPPWPEED